MMSFLHSTTANNFPSDNSCSLQCSVYFTQKFQNYMKIISIRFKHNYPKILKTFFGINYRLVT